MAIDFDGVALGGVDSEGACSTIDASTATVTVFETSCIIAGPDLNAEMVKLAQRLADDPCGPLTFTFSATIPTYATCASDGTPAYAVASGEYFLPVATWLNGLQGPAVEACSVEVELSETGRSYEWCKEPATEDNCFRRGLNGIRVCESDMGCCYQAPVEDGAPIPISIRHPTKHGDVAVDLPPSEITKSKEWCQDAFPPFSHFHGETCYRRYEAPENGEPCGKSDQYCFAPNGCGHSSPDGAAYFAPPTAYGQYCMPTECVCEHVEQDVFGDRWWEDAIRDACGIEAP